MHESSGLKSEWFEEINLFLMKYSYSCYTLNSQRSFQRLGVKILFNSLLKFYSNLLEV